MNSNQFFNVFIDGILYFFGIKDNPLEKYRKSQKSDADNLEKDWQNIGKDIQKAYEQEISGCKA